MRYDIYTDGSCLNNPGPGGYSFIIATNSAKGIEIVNENSGGEQNTTNNRMELRAIVEALKYFRDNLLKVDTTSSVRVFSDSAYCVNAINKRWIKKWINNGWKTSNGKDVQNRDLFEEINKIDKQIDFQIIFVKGHNGNYLNERCDELAKEQSAKFSYNKK